MRWLERCFAATLASLMVVSLAVAQRDILRDIVRALKEPKPVGEILAKTPITVVANDETLFNLFRSHLPPIHAAEFVPLSELPKRASELAKSERSLVVIVDRSRADFPIEHRQLVTYDLTLIRRQDVIIASDFVQEGKIVRYRVFISAPSFGALKQAISQLTLRTAKEPRDLRFSTVIPVSISVVVTNAGQEAVNVFAERTPLNFIWTTPEELARVQDLLVTETEVYLLLPPAPEKVRERLPFNLGLISPNQSVVARKNKGGNYWQVLIYGAFPQALHYLIRRYPDPSAVPDEPVVLTHPLVGSVKRMLVVPFGDISIYRDRVGDFAAQVFQSMQGTKFSDETVSPERPIEPLLGWTPFQEGYVEAKHIAALAKANNADLVLTGRLVSFDTQSVTRQELSSRPSPAADRRIWEVTTVRTEKVTARLEVRLHDGYKGEIVWTKVVDGVATKSEPIARRRTEAAQPPTLRPDRVSAFVYDDRLYASAATVAIAELIEAMQSEIRWLKEPLIAPVVPVTPLPAVVEGIVGRVDGNFVYVDIGSNQNIKVGDTLLLYREVIVKTERKTVRLEEEIGHAKVVAVFPEACKAKVRLPLKGKVEVGIRARLIRQTPQAEPQKEGAWEHGRKGAETESEG